VNRRPAIILVTILVLAATGFAYGGIHEIHQRRSGEQVQAKVTGCSTGRTGKATTVTCTGSWVAGGALVGGNGHVVLGTIEGATFDDIGHELTVRAHGDQAFTGSLRLPIILLVLALVCLAPIVPVVNQARQPPRPR
jgi:hypothetical protein